MLSKILETHYPLGNVILTPNARTKLSGEEVNMALIRHLRGDEGELDEYARREPERAALDGCRRLSVYRAANGHRFWIITESDFALTTVLLPEDF